MAIDVHNHIGRDKDGKYQSIDKLKHNMKAYGIEKAVIFPFNEQSDLISASRKLLSYKSNAIIPFLRFNPKTVGIEEIEKQLEENNFAGVKLHPKSQDFDPLNKRYYEIYRTIQKFSIPVLFHTKKENNENTDPDRIKTLAARFPKLKIILGHFAGESNEALKYLKTHNNLYVETSIFSASGILDMIIKTTDQNRILFGSDTPYSDMEIEILKIKKSGLTENQKEKVLYYNAAKLLQI